MPGACSGLLVGISLASNSCSHSENKPGEIGNKIDERWRIQASDVGGWLYRVFAGRWIGAGANPFRNVTLCHRSVGQYARPEYSGFDPRSLCGEPEHLRPPGFLWPQTTQRQMGV